MTCKPQNAPDVTTLMSAAQTGTTKSSVAMMIEKIFCMGMRMPVW